MTVALRPDLGRKELERLGFGMEYVTDTRGVCNAFQAEQGETLSDHAPPDDYEVADLLDMLRYTHCPLHIMAEYPDAPEGVWKREVARAGDRLEELTRDHLGLAPKSRRPRRGPLVATAAEVERVWEAFPHARWWWERFAQEAPADDQRFAIHHPEA